MTSLVRMLAERWLAGKEWLEASVPFHHDWLHLAAGLAIYLWLSGVMRRSSLFAWLAALIVGALNEAVDISMPHTANILAESAVDLGATIALPTVLMLIEWWRRPKA